MSSIKYVLNVFEELGVGTVLLTINYKILLIHHFGTIQNISATMRWIAMKHSGNSSDFDDTRAFPW